MRPAKYSRSNDGFIKQHSSSPVRITGNRLVIGPQTATSSLYYPVDTMRQKRPERGHIYLLHDNTLHPITKVSCEKIQKQGFYTFHHYSSNMSPPDYTFTFLLQRWSSVSEQDRHQQKIEVSHFFLVARCPPRVARCASLFAKSIHL